MFVGAGGASLKLLQISGIPEIEELRRLPDRWPVPGIPKPAIAERHKVKVYGMAETGSPPMSVPHIDARKLEGKPRRPVRAVRAVQHQVSEGRFRGSTSIRPSTTTTWPA